MSHSISFENNDHYLEYVDEDDSRTDIVIAHIVKVERRNHLDIRLTTTAGVDNLVFDSEAKRDAARIEILSKL